MRLPSEQPSSSRSVKLLTINLTPTSLLLTPERSTRTNTVLSHNREGYTKQSCCTINALTAQLTLLLNCGWHLSRYLLHITYFFLCSIFLSHTYTLLIRIYLISLGAYLLFSPVVLKISTV